MTVADRIAPRVTACVPVWNAAAFVGPVLDSLAAQTYSNLTIDISVDASTDASADICRRFAAERDDVTLTAHNGRLGWIANSNTLLRAVDSEYVFFALHDDPLDARYVERLVAALEARPDAVLAFSDVDSNLGTTFRYDVLDDVTDRFQRARRVLHAEGAWWVPFRGVMRTSAVRTLGGLQRHAAGEFSADWPWLLRLALLGNFVRVPEALVCKRFHTASLSSIWRKGRWNAFGVQSACWRIIVTAGFSPWQQLYLVAEAALYAVGIGSCPRWLRGVRSVLLRGFARGASTNAFEDRERA